MIAADHEQSRRCRALGRRRDVFRVVGAGEYLIGAAACLSSYRSRVANITVRPSHAPLPRAVMATTANGRCHANCRIEIRGLDVERQRLTLASRQHMDCRIDETKARTWRYDHRAAQRARKASAVPSGNARIEPGFDRCMGLRHAPSIGVLRLTATDNSWCSTWSSLRVVCPSRYAANFRPVTRARIVEPKKSPS